MRGGDFWSRRKAAVEAEARTEAAAVEAAREAEAEAALAERDDAEILAELGLPEPETLETSEQVRAFLASAVPQRLKTRALRRLWTTNPVLANLDGLNDYDTDFTDAATCVENIQTLYKVGRGMVDRALEVPADPAPEQDAPDETEAPEELIAANEPPSAEEPAETDAPQEIATAQEAAPTVGRMRFRFETG
ncbi:DUF3306 domain-containing protein [Tropicimonas sediminicola]|uniref:DUF3306 domain-containing protein n=1 Tax=Tropicimonas sediminicola TaxID=1031541 RepID=A0A239D5N8_9RHOB|nr:DUF3306 domain-containing protein [Tropicimonas sediminicola]SNS27171.1 Protein of unknown function [Tropicimonas sediminicola]